MAGSKNRGSGRPSDYSEELAEAICEAIIDGKSLRRFCAQPHMPNRSTVFRWLEQHEDFATKYTRARRLQSEFLDDLVQDTADESTPETAAADRVKIAAYQWRASKLAPKKYGDRVLNEHSGPDGGPIETKDVTDLDRAKALAALLAKVKAGKGE